MRDRASLQHLLRDIDRRGYGSYKQLRGRFALDPFQLVIDHVQADPYAPPSKIRIILDRDTAALPDDLVDDPRGRMATGDFLARCFARAAREQDPGPAGADRSPRVRIGEPGQEVIERSSVLIAPDRVEARLQVPLPADGRRINGRQAADLLLDLVPRIAEASLRHENLDQQALRDHVTLVRDQEDLRARLAPAGLIALVGDGAILPRRSGDSDLPLTSGAVPFAGPDSLRVSFDLPSGRTVTGMGVREGVTVIIGGGFHGKSTLLRAIERGIFGHIAGDGREWVITRDDAVTVRAEDGRAVTGVDISPYIGNLPTGADTRQFTSTNASGSTSQAANLVEALDSGSSTVLIDEDTSATNFMIRDERMRELIPADREPITPFIDRIRPLLTRRGVSTVLVAGGSGAFFSVADHVIALDAYVPADVTAAAHRLADGGHGPDETPAAGASGVEAGPDRVPDPRGLRPPGKHKPARARGSAAIQYGKGTIDLSAVAQLVDPAQTEAIACAIDRLAEDADGEASLADLVRQLCRRIDEGGLEAISPFPDHPGHLARPRPQEIHAAVNRYRGLTLREPGGASPA